MEIPKEYFGNWIGCSKCKVKWKFFLKKTKAPFLQAFFFFFFFFPPQGNVLMLSVKTLHVLIHTNKYVSLVFQTSSFTYMYDYIQTCEFGFSNCLLSPTYVYEISFFLFLFVKNSSANVYTCCSSLLINKY